MSSNKLAFPTFCSNGTECTILKTIRDCSPISRTRIAEKSGLSDAAISRSCAQLIKKGVLIDSALADQKGQRRKRGMSLNHKYGKCLAVEYGPSKIEAVIMDTAYNKVDSFSEKNKLATLSQKEKLIRITEFIKKVLNKTTNCIGIAIIDPGIVDIANGTAVMSSTMDNWKDVPIVEILQNKYRLPVMLLNTSMAKLRAIDRIELRGAFQNLIYIEYAEGIGCGLKLNGIYMSGQNDVAGELGHIRVTDKEIPCRCGGFGCLESVAALPALVKNINEAIDEGSSSTFLNKRDLTGLDVLKASATGDRLATHVIDSGFHYLAISIAGLVNILNPEIVVFDSVFSNAGHEIQSNFLRSLKKNILPSHQKSLELKFSKLKSHTGPIGGASAVIDKCIECLVL